MGRAESKSAIVLVSIATLTATLAGCATPNRPYTQLPIRMDVFVVQNDRFHFPRTVLTGPLPNDITMKAAIPGDPWSEAAKVIAQAVSDCFKWGYDAGKHGASHEVGWSTTTYRLFGIQWGNSYDLERAKLMWEAHLRFLDKLPTPIPMYRPNVEDFARAMQAFQGWRDELRGK